MIGGTPLKMCGYKTRAVINRARLMVARVRYISQIVQSSTMEYCFAKSCQKMKKAGGLGLGAS